MKKLIVVLIRLYQRYLSPYKGYRCAHAALHGGASCSDVILAAVNDHGSRHALRQLQPQLAACKAAYATLMEQGNKDKEDKKENKGWKRCRQACDCNPISSCHTPGRPSCNDLPSDCSLF